MAEPDAGWVGRTARAQKFGWNPDNSPDFGRPRGFNISLEEPSSDEPTTAAPTTTGSTTQAPNSSSWIFPSSTIILVLVLHCSIL